MFQSILSRLSFFACCFCLVLSVSCGKKAKTKTVGGSEINQQPVSTDIEKFMEKQSVACESNSYCPNYLAKIVVVDSVNNYRYCTGFLTDSNTIATSSSCLPSLMRREGQDCSGDIFIFFPKTFNREAERVGCKEVIKFSPLVGQDPNLWHDDVSFLALERPLTHRRKASISRDGIPNNRTFNAWMVDQQGSYAALIKKTTCQAIHNNYINPLASHVSSPNMLFADCGLTLGSTGAPVLDNQGKIRGMISKGISKKLKDSINSFGWLSEPLKEMAHGTNFACAPLVDDEEMLDERECMKEISDHAIAELRGKMTSFGLLFEGPKNQLKEALESKSKYVKFDVKYVTKDNVQVTNILPRCFNPLKNWLSTLSNVRNNYVFNITLPVIKYIKQMDSNGRVSGVVEEEAEKPFFVQFSLKQLRSDKKSILWMWNSIDNLTFPNMSEECSLF